MAVKLEYYQIDPVSKNKTKITSALSFGNMFKGTNKKIPITIFNAGDTEAVSPVISIKEYPDGNYQEPYKWKKVSFDEHKNYTTSLNLPNIKPGEWLEGETVQLKGSTGIIMGEGDNNGLVNVTTLTNRLNYLLQELDKLKAELSTHTHTGVISGAATSGPPAVPLTTVFTPFQETDYQDTSIIH